ncbi:hypothetical protein HJC23_008670 [Cyclotella cryptica]|uniref:Fe2OG dioxygenase domain-containing protein n=1 Tax=Cyclotella cryptica TaxID=29204 RepID=A0ABD3QI10_9STRA|eukprot:CCRYP_005387-RA/>CCRYP_005387-RA protein AED:0.00 eAED:0.00 QI:245/-1/1/1/-1/1/1/290/260
MSPITFRKRQSSALKSLSVQDLSSDLIPVTGKTSFAIVIHNLLSPDECSSLIRRAEDEGFDHALIHGPDGKEVLNQTVRNCGRCIIDDEQLSNTIYQRIRDAVRGTVWEKKMQTFTLRKHHDGDSLTASAVGLNERMRFLKYEPGQFFAPHHDIRYVRGPEFGPRAGETSYVTVHIYLNDKVKGGSTRFLCGTRYYDVNPKVGSVLIFDHDLLHEGSKVTSGVKYSVRTDIMYRNPAFVEDKGVLDTPSTIGSDDGSDVA